MDQSVKRFHADAALARANARHVAVIGGGASGVLAAAHLLAARDDLRVTIIEPRPLLGRGLAYSTSEEAHLLNTRAGRMSAWPDRPDHFLRWLHARGARPDPESFVSRRQYGRYLGSLLEQWQDSWRLTWMRAPCRDLVETATGVTLTLANGQQVVADICVLATGYLRRDPPSAYVAADLPPEAQVVIVGTGLAMVDQVISAVAAGHTGPILAVSRRGLLPRVHAGRGVAPLRAEVLPIGAPPSRILRHVRALVAAAEAQGGHWQEVVDGLRPHVRAFWQAASRRDRTIFLRHLRPWWEVHRHRMPPEAARLIDALRAEGRLQVRRGALAGPVTDGALRLRFAGEPAARTVPAGRVIDCRGPDHGSAGDATGLMPRLLARGLVRPDAHGLGPEVDRLNRLVGQDGWPSARLFGIGPVCRASHWEVTGIPEIRDQAAEMAVLIAALGPYVRTVPQAVVPLGREGVGPLA